MSAIEHVLNSDENLPMEKDGVFVSIGNISIPAGSGSMHITRLEGEGNSMALKRSILKESNDDHLCMASSIGRCFLKLCKVVTLSERKEMTANDDSEMNTTMRVIKHRATTKSFFKHVNDRSVPRYRKNMALTLCRAAGLPTDKPLSITDIKHFENLLDVNILVISAKLGNKFCRVANNADRANIYLYLSRSPDSGDGQYDGIASINGFFGFGYFCETCLKAYKNKGKHACETTCDVCCSDNCRTSDCQMSCRFCHRTCRNATCYERHSTRKDKRGKDTEKSTCEKIYQSKNCKKVIDRANRKPEEHRCSEWRCPNCFEYQMGQHQCYQRNRCKDPKTVPRKYFFYDFETTQNEIMSCGRYLPGPPCKQKCRDDRRCVKCKTCMNCRNKRCSVDEQCIDGYNPGPHCVKRCTEKSRCNECRICGNCLTS